MCTDISRELLSLSSGYVKYGEREREIERERERERERGGVKKEGRERERASQITILEKQQPGLDKMNESKK